MTAREEKAVAFLREKLKESPYFIKKPEAEHYRLEHTFRVAAIGREIARAEGLDEEKVVLGCILHDVSYCREFHGHADWKNHGREAAKIARPFLTELGLAHAAVEEICYGIAIHVDNEADFDGERTAVALTIGDADNIDRFDAYRIYETLDGIDFRKMPLQEKIVHVEATLEKLEDHMKLHFATETATKLWRERVSFYREFYRRLAGQFRASVCDGEKTTMNNTATHPVGDWLLGVSGRF